jgi:hypothetical protein
VRELFWAAILNGIISAPIMAAMMLIAQRTAHGDRGSQRDRDSDAHWRLARRGADGGSDVRPVGHRHHRTVLSKGSLQATYGGSVARIACATPA